MLIFFERNFSLKCLIYQRKGMRQDLTLFWHGGSPSLQWGVSDAACQVLVIVNWAGTVVKWANCREWSTKFTKCTPTVTGGGSLNYYLTPPIFPGNRSLHVQEKMSMHKLQKTARVVFHSGWLVRWFWGSLIVLLFFTLRSIQVGWSVKMTKNQTTYFCLRMVDDG